MRFCRSDDCGVYQIKTDRQIRKQHQQQHRSGFQLYRYRVPEYSNKCADCILCSFFSPASISISLTPLTLTLTSSSSQSPPCSPHSNQDKQPTTTPITITTLPTATTPPDKALLLVPHTPQLLQSSPNSNQPATTTQSFRHQYLLRYRLHPHPHSRFLLFPLPLLILMLILILRAHRQDRQRHQHKHPFSPPNHHPRFPSPKARIQMLSRCAPLSPSCKYRNSKVFAIYRRWIR